VDDVKEIAALLRGQSSQTELSGQEAGIWWRNLPLGFVRLKQGRVVAAF